MHSRRVGNPRPRVARPSSQAFCHVPPFVFSADEPPAYFNLETTVRRELLTLLAEHDVSACFSGHYHRNAGGVFTTKASGGKSKSLEVVVTGACGVNVSTRAVGDPLEIAGMGPPREVSEAVSGMRLVRVGSRSGDVTHTWCSFQELQSIDAAEAAGGVVSSSVASRSASKSAAAAAAALGGGPEQDESPPKKRRR